MTSIQRSLKNALLIVASIWIVFLIDISFSHFLGRYGIYPRHLSGLMGILVGPWIHFNLIHVSSNTIPLFVLTFLLWQFFPKESFYILGWILVGSGLLTWLFARSVYHIGASGVIYGLIGFFLSAGFHDRSIKTLGIGLIIWILYGGAIWGIFPTLGWISWEGHLAGFITGIFIARHICKAKQRPQNG